MAQFGYSEEPRLSSMLRRFLRKGASSGTELAEEAHRRQALMSARRRGTAGGSAGGLSLAFFQPASGGASAAVRGAYHGLCRGVAQALGELPPDALALAAAAVYNSLVDQTSNGPGAATALERSLGVPVGTSAATELAQHCRILHQQRATLVPSGTGTCTTDAPAAASPPRAPAFAQALRFVYDGGADVPPEPAPALAISSPVVTPPAAGPSRPAAAQPPTKVDSAWLAAEVTKYLSSSAMGSGLSAAELTAHIRTIVLSAKSEQTLQGQLFEVLGEAGVELISAVVTQRAALAKALREGPQQPQQVQRLVGQLTVQSAEEVARARRERKRGQRAAQVLQSLDGPALGEALDARALRATHEAHLRDAAAPRPLRPAGSLDATSPGAAKLVLPEGHSWNRYKDYDEVVIPPPSRSPQQQAQAQQETRVPITELDEFGRLAFPNYTHLNRIQSILFPCAYRSNENLLVCAPTGAGKTDIAMLTIVHEVEQHLRGGVLHAAEFKIVYVAPMKALAAEMVANLGRRLQRLGVATRELTGDMQLSKRELEETQLIVTTPEKWDVVTRKSSDVGLTSKVRLLILDEVHLLHEERGPVLESLVARTLRQVEATQQMIRIVGLSATLPNYRDVARFLRVNDKTGLFHFDATFRPVPLAQTYVGVREPPGANPAKRLLLMNEITFKKAHERVLRGHQVMVFVHSRKDTVNTAKALALMVQQAHEEERYRPDRETKGFAELQRQVDRSRNRELKELFPAGFGIHHAGMLRTDRVLVETLFRQGLLRVLCCTATLAWGVNLPARAVIIKGTQVYNAAAGAFVPLGMLDVMQIFGRAGRPQFDSLGEGVIITARDQLEHYLQLMTHQLPIESRFDKQLADHLNAEIVLGTVANVDDACTWLRYTYLYQRMAQNPLVYGLTPLDVELDPQLATHCRALVISAARTLDAARMVRFDTRLGSLHATDLGRTASHYYIEHHTIEEFNDRLSDTMTEEALMALVAHASEFAQIRVRDEEQVELDALLERCPVDIRGEDGPHAKVNILLQAYLSNEPLEAFALISDSAYIAQNAARIVRGLFEIALKRGWSQLALQLLTLSRCMERRLWHFQHPLRQYPGVSPEIITKLEQAGASLERVRDMSSSELGSLLRHPRLGGVVANMARELPQLDAEASIQPVTRSILRVTVRLRAAFKWNERLSGSAEPFWVWMADPEHSAIYHVEYFVLQRKEREQEHELQFVVPVAEPLPAQYLLHVAADRWLGVDSTLAVSFKHLILPHLHPPHTELLNLEPLPLQALHNPAYQALFRFSHFNPIQTQVFHTLMYRDCNVLLGAPTGSGKTIAAELAMFRLFNTAPQLKVVYVGPLKALVRERLLDWQDKFVKRLGKRMVELTGDYTPDVRLLQSADIVLTTPEKWDGISRNWRQRQYVKQVGLLVLDEIHLLGEERGPILEVIVSRMRYIAEHTGRPIRIVGLSTALANASDIAEWLGIDPGGVGMYNFRPAVRPVPLEVHIQAFPGKHYCPRMASMNKPVYSAIRTHSPDKPTLVFVSSRRQTRLTAIDLIATASSAGQPEEFLHMDHAELHQRVLPRVRDANLRHTLPFGIGLHHAGLGDDDRRLVEELFAQEKIRVLISTSTLAWGVNLPAHLVVIKGTEFYDPKTKRYVDFPITDVLQMMGRAGRPQFDTSGIAVIMVYEPKKNFYRKFLYDPFPVESSLAKVLHDHLNAEIVAGTIGSKQDAVDYLTWTYLYRRLSMNPSYYGLEQADFESVSRFLSATVDTAVRDLSYAGCVQLLEAEGPGAGERLEPTALGRIASFYYLHYSTVELFHRRIGPASDVAELLRVLTAAHEYADVPVRHNEELQNEQLAALLPLPVEKHTLDSPHTKAFLLLQAHFSHAPLPIQDFVGDSKTVLDQAVRILQAMVDVAADGGWLFTTLCCVQLLQMVYQATWHTSSALSTLPHTSSVVLQALQSAPLRIDSLPGLMLASDRRAVRAALTGAGRLSERAADELLAAAARLPSIEAAVQLPSRVAPRAEVSLRLTLTRHSKPAPVQAPRFPKRLDSEQWWAVLGSPDTGELLALRRVALTQRSASTTLLFDAPDAPGTYRYALYLLCDAYVGLDQQFAVPFSVVL